MSSPKLQIVCPDRCAPLVRLAVEDLQRYVRLLFGFQPRLVEEPSGPHVHIGCVPGLPPLGEQDYVLRRLGRNGSDALICAGGSPRATLWAVYELLEHWGVHFLIQGDVFPKEPGSFRLPEVDVHRRPVLRRRGFRVINDMANSGTFWSLADHKRLFDQLAKNRFNAVLVAASYPFQPWVHWEFRGVPRSKVALCYGYRHPIHERTIGRELFGGVTEFTNPDFQGANTYEERIAAGTRFMTDLIRAAHGRGLEVCFAMSISDLPLEILRRLPEWSEADGVRLPKDAIRQTHCSRSGLQLSGGIPELGAYATPLNPVYVDMVESWLRAHIEQYPEADCYFLGQAEFPPGGSGFRECWQGLDARHGVEKHFPLASLEEKARTTKVTSLMPPARMVTELQGAVQTLRMWDILANERKLVETSSNPKAKLAGSFMSEYLQPVVPLVMPSDSFEFVAIVDYLPAHVAERMHTLAFAKDTEMPVSMITTIEDDNVGFFPQLTTRSLHKTVAAMREYDLEGFWFRQFDISEHEPSMHYMIRAGWDERVTPESSYREFARRVCGEGAVDETLAVFGMVEGLEAESNAMAGAGFLMPNLYAKYWKLKELPDALQRLADRMRAYADRVLPILKRADALVSRSASRGKKWAANYRTFLRFATEYPQMLAKLIEARVSYCAAQEQKAKKHLMECCRQMDGAAACLEGALGLSEKALSTWAQLVVDPTDLGTLAALNAYGHDYLRGLAWLVYLESQHFGFEL